MAESSVSIQTPELPGYFDTTNDRALVNIVPEVFADQMWKLTREHPEWLSMDEHTLRKEIDANKRKLTPTDHKLRMKFWVEHDKAEYHRGRLNLGNVFMGVCSNVYFYDWIRKSEKLAWLLCVPTSYELTVAEGHMYGISKLRQILELPMYIKNKKTGLPELDHRVVELQAKIAFALDQRVRGGITQKIEQKNMSLHMDLTKNGLGKEMEETVEALEARLKEVMARRSRAEAISTRAIEALPILEEAPTPIEVESLDEQAV